ncbi:MAG: nucleotidyltransferase family protein [bacterium]|nr:nucleotidyltransferase family protein [bacterium]
MNDSGDKRLNEITGVLQEHKAELQKKYRVKELGVFGSYVRGEQKKRSDVDILVEFNELPNIFLLIDLEDYLRKLLRKKIDLVRKGAIRAELKEIISNEVVLI